ncbi:MAG: transposase [Acidimicrobiales bacterium]
MQRTRYPAEFPRRALDLLAGDRKVVAVARDLGIISPTLYNWRRQERIIEARRPVSAPGSDPSWWPSGTGSTPWRPSWPSIAGQPSALEAACRALR